jgi:hypothetical protein
MRTVLSESTPVARKTYTCNACEWVDNLEVWKEYDLTYHELRAIVKARKNKFCIVPGQRYRKFVQVEDGRLEVFRAIPEIDAICRKYDIYEEI